MYSKGWGVTTDDRLAFYWYKKSAEQGYARAQRSLAALYGLGRGVPRNYVQSYLWESLAAAQGYEQSDERLDALEKRMTPEQIAEAQRLASEWKPR